jgi:hypothetical protein
VAYIQAKRGEKPRIAQTIVHLVRQNGGRFVKRKEGTATWTDVGNVKAREKTSQALREGAPVLRNNGVSSITKTTPDRRDGAARPPDASPALSSVSTNNSIERLPEDHANASLLRPAPLTSSFNFRPHQMAGLSPLESVVLSAAAANPALAALLLGQKRTDDAITNNNLPESSNLVSTTAIPAPVHGEVPRNDDGSGVKVKRSRGPRLKRLKMRRLEQESSSEEES